MTSDFRSALIAGLTPLDLLSRTIRQAPRFDAREHPGNERPRWFRRPAKRSEKTR